ncbi:fibronectin type III domain-containing protein [Flavimobilis soli]|uniref:fibronectin type III domain-containing protein n=1 Tax=Flavimobilis soli TaxID=442709 RepID=UPI001472EC07|nr:endonuclease/exonuclease/phosphatase family protein [Flavimobilis soli]
MNIIPTLRRSALAGAVAFAVLAGGAVVPSALVPSAEAAPVAAVVAQAKAKKPRKVAAVKLAKGGSQHHGVRVGWTWQKGVKRYQVQAATDKAFKKNKVTVVRANPTGKPARGRVEATVKGLKNATVYRVRVRAVGKNGAKGPWSAPRTVKTKVHTPEAVTSLTAVPGAKPGEVRVTWKHKSRYTTHYRLELGSTAFDDQGSKGLPKKGRKHVRVELSAKKGTSYVIPASVTSRLGLKAGSGNQLYVRLRAVNKGTAGSALRVFPGLHVVQPARPTGTTKGTTALKVGSYNVTSAPAGAAKNKPWTKRKATIASTIVASGASVVGLQELSPNTVDVNEGTVRQTESLLAAVRSAAAKAGSSADYRMVRLSPYLRPGTTSGSQGQRILYDAKRLTLVSPCSDYTTETNAAGKPVEKFWSSTCFAELASNASESDIHKRGFAYAKFRDRKSGGEFWFVSVHLDPRDGVESLRGRQAQSVVSTMKRLNTRGLPVLVTGDLNSYQNKAEGNAPHDVFVGAGYTDSYIAKSRTNAQYATVNHWDTTVSTNTHGFGIRLDYVLGLGVGDFASYVNVVKQKDSARGSDHNMVYATAYLPAKS